jgi:hypothetical protein
VADLSQIQDVEALENRYLGKAIVYVESEHDEEVYRRFAGPDVADRLEFKVTKVGVGGWMAVRDRLRQERPSNDNVYGLLDGEAAVHFDGWEALIACQNHIFSLTVAEAEGIFFISGHELENLLMKHGDICGLIVKEVRLGDLAKHKVEEVQVQLVLAARRFFAAAAIKYVLADLERRGVAVPDFKLSRFRDPEQSAVSLLLELRKEIKAAGLDWKQVRGAIQAVLARLKARFVSDGLGPDARDDHYVRLADGKAVVARLREVFTLRGPLDGHLVDTASRAAYAAEFRAELLQLTQAA